jgi:hypothetical protein
MSPGALEAANREAAREAVEWENWLPLAADRLIDRGWGVEKACTHCLAAGAIEDAEAAAAAFRQTCREIDARQKAANRLHMEKD